METEQTFWDPLSETITSHSFQNFSKKNLKSLQTYEKYPHRIRNNMIWFTLIPIIAVLVYFRAFGFGEMIFWVGILSALPLIIYYSSIHSLQQSLILYLITKEHGWLYNPDKRSPKERISTLINMFPSIMNMGHGQDIQNQIWGRSDKNIDFWFSDFSYTTGSGKHSTTHLHTLIIIKLRKLLPAILELESTRYLSWGKSYKTESEEFNKLFRIKMNDPNDTEVEMLQILSPSMQVRLVDLAQILPIWKIVLYKDMMAIDLNERLFNPKYTNFIKQIKIDERDKQMFLEKITTILEIPSDMLQFID